MEDSSPVSDEMDETDSVKNDLKESIAVNCKMESNAVNGETSEVEDLDISDSEVSSPGYDGPLSIDSNARIVPDDVRYGNKGDDCDMHFVEKHTLHVLSCRSSEAGLHTSIEDLNVSDDEEQFRGASAMHSVNLDGRASASRKDINSLSTLNYSHTVFKDEYNTDIENFSDDESCYKRQKKQICKDKPVNISPRLTIEGIPFTTKTNSSLVLPSTQEASDTYKIKSMFTNSQDVNELHNLYDEQEFPPITGFEYSDDHNTDAEDITFGSLDDIIESSRNRNPFGKGYNAFNIPEALPEFSCNNDNEHSYLGDSRRSSATELHTDDETFCLENFADCGKKRVKKYNARLVDKNDKSEDSLTDEEVIEDQ